jgi:hypothetical protein
MLRYPSLKSDPPAIYELLEIQDKGKNSAAAARSQGIAADKIIIIGDSGGDGPHFEWGTQTGAFLIGSMIKPSLDSYCRKNRIAINLRVGLDFNNGTKKDPQNELQVNFMDLARMIAETVNR